MDVEDALELLGPSWEYHDLRRWLKLVPKSSKNASLRYAVGRLAQASDEDLQLYLMQLVQVILSYDAILLNQH